MAPAAVPPAISTSSFTCRNTSSSSARVTTSIASCRSTIPTLALGGTVKVPTLNGREDLSIPGGTQPGARFRVRGKGMPNVNGRGHGDLHVIARAAVPKKLTKEQKRILEEFSKTLPAQVDVEHETDGSFFDKVKDIFT